MIWVSRCLCLSVCIRSSMCHVCQPELVCIKTHYLCKQIKPPNLDKRCKTSLLSSLLFWGAIYQVKPELVPIKTHYLCKPEPPNFLHKSCKTPYMWLSYLLFLGATYLDLQNQIQLKNQNFIMPVSSNRVNTPCILALEYLHRFTVPTFSQFSSHAGTYLPRLLHGPDCFTVSNPLHIYWSWQLRVFRHLMSHLIYKQLSSLWN